MFDQIVIYILKLALKEYVAINEINLSSYFFFNVIYCNKNTKDIRLYINTTYKKF